MVCPLLQGKKDISPIPLFCYNLLDQEFKLQTALKENQTLQQSLNSVKVFICPKVFLYEREIRFLQSRRTP